MAVGVLLALAGCSALRRIQVFPVVIVNDTGAPVVVRDCDTFCSSSLLTFDLQPGASAVINRTTKMHKRFSVTTPGGDHIGCLDLYFATPQPEAQVLVSGATACPSGPHRLWKLIGLVLLVALLVALLTLFIASRPRRTGTSIR